MVLDRKELPDRMLFGEWVRDALSRLYDSVHLRASPLISVLDDSMAVDGGRRLRKAIIEAISTMHPPPGVPAHSPDWRRYQILELRFIDARPPTEVMEELSLGRSQFFSDQSAAVAAVVEALWQKAGDRQMEAVRSQESAPRDQLLQTAMQQLRRRVAWEQVDVSVVIGQVLALAQPLAKEKGVELRTADVDALCVPHASYTIVRQALLAVLTYALGSAEAESIEVSASIEDRCISVTVCAPGGQLLSEHGLVPEGLNVARQLVETVAGSLHTETVGAGQYRLLMEWARDEPLTLVAVDDNPDFLDLLRRYLIGSGWQLVSAPTATAALDIVSSQLPTALMMDVLMPAFDGWQLLAELRGRKATRKVPIIVCSVLVEPDLALSLGADLYLPKPIGREDLLAALAQWDASLPSGR